MYPALPLGEELELSRCVEAALKNPYAKDVDAVVFTKTPVDAIQALNDMAALLRQKERCSSETLSLSFACLFFL